MPPRPLLGPQPPSFLGADDPYMRVPGHENVGKPKPKAKDRRNWQQKTRDWLNEKGREYLGPHGDQAFGLLGMASEFTDAADIRDAMDYSKKTVDAVRQGDWWGAAGAAPWMLAASGAAMMPGVSLGAADEVADGVKKGIRAYHGSPHDFDKFDMSKIGTGEGAQAYGHGLYFADSEGVARSYRDTLAAKQDGALAKYGLSPGGDTNRVKNLIAEYGDRLKNPDDVIAAESASMRKELEAVLADDPATVNRAVAEWEDKTRRQIAYINDTDRNPGRMYEVNINADPDAFLDWDKPLSEQPEAVKQVLRPLVGDSLEAQPGRDYQTGEQFYRDFVGKIGGQRDKLISKYGDEAYFRNAGDLANRELGIPGIKYLDAGSRGAGDGTRNYVVFDDRLVSIVRKYGIAGASAILGYNVLSGMDPAQASELQQMAGSEGSGW
jgi:hypothetical protein